MSTTDKKQDEATNVLATGSNQRCHILTREGTTTEFHSSTSRTPLVDY